jgi:hypothetical protein
MKKGDKPLTIHHSFGGGIDGSALAIKVVEV